MDERLSALSEAVFAGRLYEIADLVDAAAGSGLAPRAIVEEGLMPGISRLGALFKNGQVFIPEVLLSAETMKAAVARLRPLLAGEGVGRAGKVVVGTVKGDLHDVGKNIAATFLEAAGYEVVDLGVDVPEEEFCQALAESGAKVLGLSAMLTTTMAEMAEVLRALERAGLRGGVKVFVAGAPVSQAFCDGIGADGYAPDALAGLDLVRELGARA
jgi:5-methyltetrahydrofolate--homocysteine methyltransferase